MANKKFRWHCPLKNSKIFLWGRDAESVIDSYIQNFMMFPTRALLKMA